MAQNITLMGASYTDVPAVELPKTGGGTASFTDVTDTTATASDVAQGKYFYTDAGVRTEGTSSGGGGGTKLYFVQDGRIVSGNTLTPQQSVTITEETEGGVDYLKFYTGGSAWGFVVTQNIDLSAYDFLVVELVEINGTYGNCYTPGGIGIGRGVPDTGTEVPRISKIDTTVNGNSGAVYTDKFILTIPSSNSGHYIKFNASSYGGSAGIGLLNVLNIYALAE